MKRAGQGRTVGSTLPVAGVGDSPLPDSGRGLLALRQAQDEDSRHEPHAELVEA